MDFWYTPTTIWQALNLCSPHFGYLCYCFGCRSSRLSYPCSCPYRTAIENCSVSIPKGFLGRPGEEHRHQSPFASLPCKVSDAVTNYPAHMDWCNAPASTAPPYHHINLLVLSFARDGVSGMMCRICCALSLRYPRCEHRIMPKSTPN